MGFNKSLIEAPLNNSRSKASYAFAKAKRFSNVSVNEQGFAISVLGSTRNKSGFADKKTSAATHQFGIAQMPASMNMLNKQSGSIEHIAT